MNNWLNVARVERIIGACLFDKSSCADRWSGSSGLRGQVNCCTANLIRGPKVSAVLSHRALGPKCCRTLGSRDSRLLGGSFGLFSLFEGGRHTELQATQRNETQLSSANRRGRKMNAKRIASQRTRKHTNRTNRISLVTRLSSPIGSLLQAKKVR